MDNNYLIERETLGQLIDELLKHKALPVDSPAELTQKREELMRALDKKIGLAIFRQFNDEQRQEYDRILNSNDSTPEDSQAFFDKAGINLDQTILDAMQDFSKEFLGGKNE